MSLRRIYISKMMCNKVFNLIIKKVEKVLKLNISINNVTAIAYDDILNT